MRIRLRTLLRSPRQPTSCRVQLESIASLQAGYIATLMAASLILPGLLEALTPRTPVPLSLDFLRWGGITRMAPKALGITTRYFHRATKLVQTSTGDLLGFERLAGI